MLVGEPFSQFIASDDIRQRKQPLSLKQRCVRKSLPCLSDGRASGRQVVLFGILCDAAHHFEAAGLEREDGLHWQKISPDLTWVAPNAATKKPVGPVTVQNAKQRG